MLKSLSVIAISLAMSSAAYAQSSSRSDGMGGYRHSFVSGTWSSTALSMVSG